MSSRADRNDEGAAAPFSILHYFLFVTSFRLSFFPSLLSPSLFLIPLIICSRVDTATRQNNMTATSNAQLRLATVSAHLASAATDPVSSALETSLPPVKINRDALSVLLDGEDQTWRNWVSHCFSCATVFNQAVFKEEKKKKKLTRLVAIRGGYNDRCLIN